MVKDEISKLILKPLEEIGYELKEVSFNKENGNDTLHIVVDKDDDISLDDIVKVSDLVSSILDEHDPIKSAYFLDVSSLGAEKPIDVSKLSKYIGKYVNIHVINPIKGENYLEGYIKDVNDTILLLEIQIKANKKSLEIPLKDIDKARLAIKF